jgi:serine/threonine protein kinase/Tol biopolymer transport system component
MDQDLWKRVDALLEKALAQPPDQREAFVTGASKDDAELRNEVLSLLKAQEQAANFMERSAMKVAAEALAQDSNLTNYFSLIGKELANYKIEKLLGAGGMGEVYLARDTKLKRPVALKILPWHFVADLDRATRFRTEARALSSLNHPNLITVYEVGEADGLLFIATEFVEGQTLSALRQKLTLRELLAIVAQVAEALSAAHKAGIVHRDIKPDNVMVRPDGYVKVLDFGLVKLTEVAASKTSQEMAKSQLGAPMGTLAYMSPEQATGEPVDHRTDIWSLGVVIYELATGKKPFAGDTRHETVNAILSSEPNPARSIDETFPSELDQILTKALEKDRELRYQTASDFRADIRRLLRMIDSSATASNPRAITSPVPKFVRRTWFWPLAIVAVLIVAAIPLGWYLTRAKPVAPDWSRAVRLQLTTQPGTEYFPTFTPDGKSFVYAAEQNGNWDLFEQRVGGKNVTTLTPNTPSNESQAAFSPDGEYIAFRSTRDPPGLYVMERTGENARLLIAGCRNPSWSPDGKEIACSTGSQSVPSVRNSRPSSLWIIGVATGAKRVLYENDAMQPMWSPQGNRIAFWYMPRSSGRSEVATISKDGGQIEVITKDGATNWNPAWSPDGKFLYYVSDRGGSMGFWRVPIDELTGKVQGEPEAVVTPSTFSRHLNFSRDGRRMIYVQTEQESNIQAVKFDPIREKVIGDPFWITRGDQQLVRPDLSPDGTHFVTRLQRRTQDDIAIFPRDGTNARDITNDRYFDRYPRWSPDGKRIAFTSDRTGQYEIWIIDANGTNLRQVSFNSPGDTSFPLWSADGQRILFRRAGVNLIVDLNKDWANQTLEELPREASANFVVWDWSADGKRLIGTDGASRVHYYSFETKRFEKVSDGGAYPMWLADGVRFLFLWDDKVYLSDISTKRVREILSLQENRLNSIGISRDSQLIYFAVYSTESDIWLLDLP